MKRFILRSVCKVALGFLSSTLYGDAQPYYQDGAPLSPQYVGLPWLTGTLLTPGENIVSARTWNIEPYLILNNQYGNYDSDWQSHSLLHSLYSFQSITFIQYGITPHFDVQLIPQFSWNHTQGASQWTVGDMGVIFDFQLLYMKKGHWWPNIKFGVGGDIPLGKYQHLSLKKKGTDKGGTGSINPTALLVIGRVFQFSPFHFLRARTFLEYTIPNSVHVKGLNTYGGGKETRGVVYPGSSFTGVLGFEYTLSANWALSCDFQYLHTNKQHFKGKTQVSMKAPSSEGFSLAPAIEYNWNTSLGIISGIWFSVAGRNSPEFVNWVSAINVNF